MSKSSINVKAVKPSSESHNTRSQQLDYVVAARSGLNEQWQSSSILEMEREVKRYCKEKSGRKLQKNAEPIREAVVNIDDTHDMNDLHKLCDDLEKEFGMKAFQIYIHRDEGHYTPEKHFKGNFHAHIVFRWQDMATGKTLRLDRKQMSQMQDVVAKSLHMERGELKSNTNTERLEAVDYKVMVRTKELTQLDTAVNDLQAQNKALELKKKQSSIELRNLEEESERLKIRGLRLQNEVKKLRVRYNELVEKFNAIFRNRNRGLSR